MIGLNNYSQNNVALNSKNNTNNRAKIAFKGTLDGLEHKKVWENFIELTKIYKESGHNEEISNHLAEKLKKAEFDVEVKGSDAAEGRYSIVATRNVDKQKKNAIILQAHMDIVGVSVDENGKSDGNSKKPIVLERISEQIDGQKTTLIADKKGEWLKAHHRTLGADDGIGVATILTIAEDSKFKNMPLEVIFTTDEETGMYGAEALKPADFYGKQLINMDSEKIDEITIGCAGVAAYSEDKTIPMIAIGDKNHRKIVINVSGGNGGHSGVQIQEGHINPIKAILAELNNISNVKLESIEGGIKFNAIPKDARAVIYVPEENADRVIQKLNENLNKIKQAHSQTDANLKIDIQADKEPAHAESKVVDPLFQEKLLRILGKEVKSELITTYDKEHITEEKNNKTSQNLGVLKLVDGNFSIQVCSRSSDETEGKQLQKEISSQLSELLGGREVTPNHASPIWQPKENTLIEKAAVKAYQDCVGGKPSVQTCHGGLESAVFVEKSPCLEQISVGPTLKEPHTENERLEISTVKPFYNWMSKLLEALNKITT